VWGGQLRIVPENRGRGRKKREVTRNILGKEMIRSNKKQREEEKNLKKQALHSEELGQGVLQVFAEKSPPKKRWAGKLITNRKERQKQKVAGPRMKNLTVKKSSGTGNMKFWKHRGRRENNEKKTHKRMKNMGKIRKRWVRKLGG